jgi:putative transposase
LACDAFHRVFREVAAEATAWLVGRYVIMPDHVHLFAGDHGGNVPYENWVTYLKSQITKRCKVRLKVGGTGGRGSRRAAAAS